MSCDTFSPPRSRAAGRRRARGAGAFPGADTAGPRMPQGRVSPSPPSAAQLPAPSAEGASWTESYSATERLERNRCAIASPHNFRGAVFGGRPEQPCAPRRCRVPARARPGRCSAPSLLQPSLTATAFSSSCVY